LALDLVNEGVDLMPDKDLFLKAIDTYDLDLAQELLNKYGVVIDSEALELA
jgi:hypothetical protein